MSIGYDMAYAATAVITSPVWGYRLIRTGKWRTDWSSRLGHCDFPAHDDRSTLLIHAVSVGEVNAIRSLVDQLYHDRKDTLRIVISATTDTGIARARQLFEPDHCVVRYPLDLGHCVRRFLDTVRPDFVALTELEVWPNFVAECVDRRIPVSVINGRLSDRSFRNYKKLIKLVRPTFAKLTLVATQTQTYATRFEALGVPTQNIHVLDSMKWDTANTIDAETLAAGANDLAREMGINRSRPIIVAGSTGPGEEKTLISRCPSNAQLVLVPRKPERFNEVAALNPDIVRRTRQHDNGSSPTNYSRLFLLDTIGELQKAYALADVAIVGRSFLGQQHGSNPMEPIALCKPTIIGPHHDDFVDIVETFQADDGIVVTSSPGEIARQLIANPTQANALAQRGHRVIQSRQGSTKRHAELLLNLSFV